MSIAGISRTSVADEVEQLDGAPLFGNLFDFKRDRLSLFLRTFEKCGDLGVYTIGRERYYLVNSAELVQETLVKNGSIFEKTKRFRAYGTPLLGEGLLTAPNAVHKTHRRMIQPTFRKDAVAKSAEVAGECAERMSDRWQQDSVINIRREMVRLVLQIVGKNLFSQDLLDEADGLGGALTDAIHGFDSQASAMIPLTIKWPTPANLKYRRAIARLERTFYRLLAERRAETNRPQDWLSMLLDCRYEDGEALSDRQIRDEAMNMFMPGHETTATALTWTFHLLATHPESYRRLQDELDAVLQGRTPTLADLPRLPYALQVFKEAMRLYPPVYMFSRQPLTDVEVGGHRLPAGTPFIFSPYAMHRRPDYYPDPDRFDPDRFAPEQEAARPRHAYMPFGAGTRTCVGNHHALLNGHLIVAGLAQRVQFEALEPTVLVKEPMVTLRPRGDVMMRVTHRPRPAGQAGAAGHGGAAGQADGPIEAPIGRGGCPFG